MSTLRQTIRTFVDGNLSQPARGRAIANIAAAKVNELVASGKASPAWRRFTDGVEGAPPENIRPGGSIVYEFSYIADAVIFALGFLRGRSVDGPGRPKDKDYPRHYRDCYVVAVDGRPIPAADFAPGSVPLAADIIIFNTQPYSRKIDVQLVGRRALHFRGTPPGIFDDAARAVRRRFGNTVTARRVYSVTFPGHYITRNGAVQSPALRIKPVE